MLKEFYNNKILINELIEFIKFNGKKYGIYDFWIYEEWECILYILISVKNNKSIIKKSYIDNITFFTRSVFLFQKFNDIFIENNIDNTLIINYIKIFKQLQEYQIKNCNENEKQYFINLNLI